MERSASLECITFGGEDGPDCGLECETFVHTVRRKAFQDGKHTDDEWIAHFAAASLTGNALRWFEELDETTQDSWKLLRKALLSRFPCPGAAHRRMRSEAPPQSPATETLTFFIPAAPAAVAAPPMAPARLPIGIAPRAGRLRVVADVPEASGFVGCRLSQQGHMKVTTDPTKALHVQFNPSGTPHRLKLANPSQPFDWLGVHWNLATELRLGPGVSRAAQLVGINGLDPQLASSSTHCAGEMRATLWNVFLDGTLNPTWLDVVKYSLTFVIRMPDNLIGLSCDFDAFVQKSQSNWCRARLVFEPV